MSKVKIKVNVNNETKNFYTAIYQEKDKILTYKEDNNTLVKFNYNTNNLIRENSELLMEYKFIEKEKTIGKIYVKDLDKTLEVNLKTKTIKKDNINLDIKYNIEDDIFSYKIEVIK